MAYKFTWDFNYNEKGGSKGNIAELINTYGMPNTYIEVGVFEGGTIVWLNDELAPLNKNFKAYGIDPHTTSPDIHDHPLDEAGELFEHNLKECKDCRIEYIKKYSQEGLIDLINKKVKAELIYIDGNHTAGAVLTDLVLAWELLIEGGVILCDDTTAWMYDDKNGTRSAQMSPRMAVEFFIQCHWHEIEIIPTRDGIQTAIRKMPPKGGL